MRACLAAKNKQRDMYSNSNSWIYNQRLSIVANGRCSIVWIEYIKTSKIEVSSISIISLAKGKNTYDKRQVIKDRENKIQLDRIKKI